MCCKWCGLGTFVNEFGQCAWCATECAKCGMEVKVGEQNENRACFLCFEKVQARRV